MRILVTGGAGFIGSHYVRTVASGGYPEFEGADVTVLDKLTYAGNLGNLAPAAGGFTFVRGDICDANLLRDLVPGHDAVVNFAAETHVDRSISCAAEFVTSNVTGVQVLLDACLTAGVPRVVHVSTDEVYGSITTGSWTESSPLDPNSPYAAAKAGGDLIALAYARTHGLNVSITRCCNNYGPYQYPEKVIPLFATNLLDGKPVPLYGDGLNVREWIHVDDHCQGIQLVLSRGEPGRVYHINGDAELSNRELTAAILEACGASWDMVVPVTDRKGHDRRYSLDDSLLRSMGYAPQVSFSDSLKATIEWYADNREWWKPLHRPGAPRAARRTCAVTRWLVTGAGGMLAHDLISLLADQGEHVTGMTREDLDITSATAVSSAVERLKPDVVVNCAAWTAVDDAETHEDAALAVNGHGPGHLAAACRDLDAILVQVSTDYVFDGTARQPYPEDAEPAPRTAYRRTKLAGQDAVRATLPRSSYTVRTAWRYGAHGPSFVRTMIRLARAGTSLAVVDDQHGQPTWTADVAPPIHALIAAGAAGAYHATSCGQTTWFGLAAKVFRLVFAAGSDENSPERTVASPTPTTSAAYQRPAPRPAYSVLGHDAWAASGVPPIGHWRSALLEAFPDILDQYSEVEAT